MGKYNLKIKMGDGVEIDIASRDAGMVRAQLDEYFNFFNYGTVNKAPERTYQKPEPKMEQEPVALINIETEPEETPEEPLEIREAELVEPAIVEQPLEMAEEVWAPPQEEVSTESLPQAQEECHLDETAELAKCVQDKGLFDAFIAAAYFIKNVLKLDGFTIKFLNSKLFEASGRLIDHDIIIEGLNRRFLTIVEEGQGPAKYALSKQGEEYFSKL